jgi:cell division protease FtsH
VVAEVLEPGSVNLVSAANYYGNKGGLTSQTNDDNYWCSYTKMENRVKVLLAGKAATELIFNSIDTGASSDISRARRILARFLDDYGVDNFSSCDNYSADAIKARFEIWEDIKLSDYYREAKTILFNNKDKLDKIATELINNKTIIRKDIQRIMRGE